MQKSLHTTINIYQKQVGYYEISYLFLKENNTFNKI